MARRLVPALLITLLLVLHAQLWFGRGSLNSVGKMTLQIDVLNQKNAQATLVNSRLEAEVRDLKEGLEMVEEKARQELGMVKPNEIYVHISKP
jgi:cell division protein FtsB